MEFWDNLVSRYSPEDFAALAKNIEFIKSLEALALFYVESSRQQKDMEKQKSFENAVFISTKIISLIPNYKSTIVGELLKRRE